MEISLEKCRCQADVPFDGSHRSATPNRERLRVWRLIGRGTGHRESSPGARTRHSNPVSSNILDVTSARLISRALEVNTATGHGIFASGFWLPFHFPTCWNDGDLPDFLMGLEAWVTDLQNSNTTQRAQLRFWRVLHNYNQYTIKALVNSTHMAWSYINGSDKPRETRLRTARG